MEGILNEGGGGGEERVPDTFEQCRSTMTIQYQEEAGGARDKDSDAAEERVPDTFEQSGNTMTMQYEERAGGVAGENQTLQYIAPLQEAEVESDQDDQAVRPAKTKKSKKRAVLDSEDEDAGIETERVDAEVGQEKENEAPAAASEEVPVANKDDAEEQPVRKRRALRSVDDSDEDAEREVSA